MKLRLTFLLTLLFLLQSCGQSDENKIDQVIEDANIYLSSRNCAKAKEILLTVGEQKNNARWVQIYASALACSGNFDEPTFFGTDLPKLSALQGGMIGSLTTFSSSISTPTSLQYASIKESVEYLLYAGGLLTASSNANRQTIYGASDTSNMDIQTLYMLLAQMGRWFKFYGNADATGIKGTGTAANTCLMTYTDATAITSIQGGVSGSCTGVANNGHPDINVNKIPKMCEGIVLFNNFINILTNVSFTGGNTGNLGALTAVFSTLCSSEVNIPGAICTIYDQTACEAQPLANIERYSAWLFERIFL